MQRDRPARSASDPAAFEAGAPHAGAHPFDNQVACEFGDGADADRKHSTVARLSLTRVQLVDCALQLFKLLSGLTEFAFRSQTLVVGKVLGCFRDEGIEIR